MTHARDLESDRALREAWLSSQAPPDHVDEATWEALFEGHVDSVRRERVLDHIAACPRCAGIFKQARMAVREASAPTPTQAPRRGARPRPWFLTPQLAAAATVVVLIGSVVLLRPSGTAPVATGPGATASPVVPVAPAREPAVPAMPVAKAPIVIGAERLLATRSSPDDKRLLDDLARALEPYQRDDFAEAARRLADVSRNRPEVFEAAFYLGVSLLLSDQASAAVPVLERAAALASEARRDEATRYLELARARAAGAGASRR